MVVVHKNEEEEVEFKVEKTNKMAIVPTTLATFESLTFPLVRNSCFHFMIMLLFLVYVSNELIGDVLFV